jgi:myo-inositol-1(or 4)-monophosphatase
MKSAELKRALASAVAAASAAGALMRKNQHAPKVVNESFQHDIKLELDVRCQKLIERQLFKAFPRVALLGEEGVSGDPAVPLRWVVDPIDGTVNFAYGIPHACVSIALQERNPGAPGAYADGFQTLLGVVFDPFTDEMWTGMRGGPARLNGRVVHASKRAKLAEAVVALGFSKSRDVLQETIPLMGKLTHRVRKIRIFGAAALSLVYVAGGRLDAYLERGVRLWDIAAGGLIVECAGGKFQWREVGSDQRYWMLAGNGLLDAKVLRIADKQG